MEIEERGWEVREVGRGQALTHRFWFYYVDSGEAMGEFCVE